LRARLSQPAPGEAEKWIGKQLLWKKLLRQAYGLNEESGISVEQRGKAADADDWDRVVTEYEEHGRRNDG
jgi:hypothetical protein